MLGKEIDEVAQTICYLWFSLQALFPAKIVSQRNLRMTGTSNQIELGNNCPVIASHHYEGNLTAMTSLGVATVTGITLHTLARLPIAEVFCASLRLTHSGSYHVTRQKLSDTVS